MEQFHGSSRRFSVDKDRYFLHIILNKTSPGCRGALYYRKVVAARLLNGIEDEPQTEFSSSHMHVKWFPTLGSHLRRLYSTWIL
mmetsp:Transcript_31608/g.61922  ORF Transcript_31608/g.61922 Transcript_31608/m.61922 type:complete len:84 (-) Transcript_31608:266-517(-)